MEQKKNLAGAAGSGFFDRPVHERLHKAAVAKQQQDRNNKLRNQRSQSQRGPSSNQSFEQERVDKMNLSNRAIKRGLKSANRKPPVPIT